MTKHADRPIIVSGPACSGTLWTQWFLSQHPRLHVHGQPPGVPWDFFWGWFQTLRRRGQWSERINRRIGHEVPYYAGSDPKRTEIAFKRLVRRWITGFGPEKPRWGLRWPGLCARREAVRQWESLWPETRWVICLADPFATIELAKSMLAPNLDLQEAAAQWVATCEFLQSQDPSRIVLLQMDKLRHGGEYPKRRAVERLLACVGETPSKETEAFLRRFPISRAIPSSGDRRFVLSDEAKQALAEEVPGLVPCMKRMGYLTTRQTAALV